MNDSIFHEKYNIDFSRPDYSRFDADFERTKGYQHAPEYSSGFNDSKKIKAVSLKQNRKMAEILKKEGIQRFKRLESWFIRFRPNRRSVVESGNR